MVAFVLVYRLSCSAQIGLKDFPDDQALSQPWACYHCGEVYHLSPREVASRQRRGLSVNAGDAASGEPSPGAGRTSARELVLPCPKCDETQLHLAETCPQCRTVFGAMLEGEPAACPKCGWEPRGLRRPVGLKGPGGG